MRRLQVPTGFLLRALADVVSVNFSLFGALILRFFIRITWEQAGSSLEEQLHVFASFFFLASPLLTGLTLVVFFWLGVYNRTRYYARKYKAVVLFNAISLSFLIFAFCAYLFFPESTLVPRSVFLLSYLGTLLLSGGTRLLKTAAASRYEIVDRRAASRKAISRVLVVGGAGYIGSVLVRQLLGLGYQVRVLDVALYGDKALEGVSTQAGFELIQGDLRHVEAVVRAVKGCDAVVHLGAIVGDPACNVDPAGTREINTIATKLLVQVCRGYGVQRLLFASTCAVYGASDHLMDERSEINPVSLYAQTKADAEKVMIAAKGPDCCPVVLRLGTAFGDSYRPRFDLVINLLVAKAWRDKKITIYNKDQWRPFVHVHDIARAFCACLTADAALVSGEIFNVGSYTMNFTLGDVAEKIKSQLPDTEIELVESADRRNYRVSFDKIHTYLGFHCERTIEDGIREVIDYLRQAPPDVLVEEVYDNSRRLEALSHSWMVSGSDVAVAQFTEPAGAKELLSG